MKEAEKKAETKVCGMYNFIDTSNNRSIGTFLKSLKKIPEHNIEGTT
jgi:hypothetical protein